MSVTADPQFGESVPAQVSIYVQNDGRGTAVNVTCALDWAGGQFSCSLAAVDFSIDHRKPIVFGREDKVENDVAQPQIIV